MKRKLLSITMLVAGLGFTSASSCNSKSSNQVPTCDVERLPSSLEMNQSWIMRELNSHFAQSGEKAVVSILVDDPRTNNGTPLVNPDIYYFIYNPVSATGVVSGRLYGCNGASISASISEENIEIAADSPYLVEFQSETFIF